MLSYVSFSITQQRAPDHPQRRIDEKALRLDDDRLHTLTSTLNPHIQRPYGPPLLQGDRHGMESAIGLPESVVGIAGMGNIQLAGAEDREHLVVELKRPKVKIDAAATGQIKSYAFAVADDERFQSVPAKWVFWVVSNELDKVTAREVSQKDRANGILFQDEEQRLTIWGKTWSQVINECKARLQFFEEKLEYTPDRDASLEHLKTTYRKHLADLFTAESETDEPKKNTSEVTDR